MSEKPQIQSFDVSYTGITVVTYLWKGCYLKQYFMDYMRREMIDKINACPDEGI
jgi:hypothetical protein